MHAVAARLVDDSGERPQFSARWPVATATEPGIQAITVSGPRVNGRFVKVTCTKGPLSPTCVEE